MLVIGLDAAAQWKNYGYAIGQYSDGGIAIMAAGLLGDEGGLETQVGSRLRGEESALIAIDAPLGWPKALGETLSGHWAGDLLAPEADTLFRRATDNHVYRNLRKRPLDVGADRIARAAWRALDVLRRLRELTKRDIPVLVGPWDRKGIAAIEVYPAATLAAHGIEAPGYKKPEGGEARIAIARRIESRIKGIAPYAVEGDDVFDAGLCLLAALDFLEERVMLPNDLDAARKEGWIWVRRPI